MLFHILALPWIFNFNGKFWGIAYPVLRCSVPWECMQWRLQGGLAREAAIGSTLLRDTFGRAVSANAVFLVSLVGS